MSARPIRHAPWLLAFALLGHGAHAQSPAPPSPPPDYAGIAPPSPPTPFAIDPSKPQRPITTLTRVQPTYPRDQVCFGVHGTVTLIVTVGADDQVLDVQVERSSRSRELDSEAINAVRRTRWQAEIRNGQPIESRVRLPVEFVLDELPREYCSRVEITLLDTDDADFTVPATAPARAYLGLYAPVATQLHLQWRRLATPPRSEALIHEQRLNLERSQRMRRSTLDAATPQPLPPGHYALEVLVDGQLRGRETFEVR